MREKIICLVRWLLWLPVHVTCWLSCSVPWLLRRSRQLSDNFRVTRRSVLMDQGRDSLRIPKYVVHFYQARGALAHGEICRWRKANMIIGYVRTSSLVRRVMCHCLFYIRLRSFSNLYRTLPKLVCLSISIHFYSLCLYISLSFYGFSYPFPFRYSHESLSLFLAFLSKISIYPMCGYSWYICRYKHTIQYMDPMMGFVFFA